MPVYFSLRLAGSDVLKCLDAIRDSDGDSSHLVAIPDLKRFRIFGPIGIDGLALLRSLRAINASVTISVTTAAENATE